MQTPGGQNKSSPLLVTPANNHLAALQVSGLTGPTSLLRDRKSIQSCVGRGSRETGSAGRRSSSRRNWINSISHWNWTHYTIIISPRIISIRQGACESNALTSFGAHLMAVKLRHKTQRRGCGWPAMGSTMSHDDHALLHNIRGDHSRKTTSSSFFAEPRSIDRFNWNNYSWSRIGVVGESSSSCMSVHWMLCTRTTLTTCTETMTVRLLVLSIWTASNIDLNIRTSELIIVAAFISGSNASCDPYLFYKNRLNYYYCGCCRWIGDSVRVLLFSRMNVFI